MTDEVKLRYLQDALYPEPRKTIIALKSGSQYKVAISMLKNKYGSDLTVKKAYYESLENLNEIQNANNISALREFSENVEILCHGLKECGVDANQQDFIFHLVFRKLPGTLRLEFSKKVGGTECLSLKILLSLLRDHVNIASNVGYSIDSQSKDPIAEEQCFYQFSSTNQYRNRQNTGTSRNYSNTKPFDQNETIRLKPNTPCRFCNNKNHWSEDCQEYPTRNVRLKKLEKCCFKCLKSNHSTDRCFRKPWCPHCNTENSHNRAICPKKFEFQTSSNTPTDTATNFAVAYDPSSVESPDIPTSTDQAFIANTDKTEYVVFPTAVACVKRSSRSGSKKECLIAFDTMSSRSYITKSVAQQLVLTKKFHEQLSVHTFASTEPKTISSYRSEIAIETMAGTDVDIEVSVVNTIDAMFCGLQLNPVQYGRS